jgi:hypothetical protein
MSKGLIAFVLLSALALLIVGCNANAPATEVPAGSSGENQNAETPVTSEGTNTPAADNNQASAETPSESTITGDINAVDSIKSELDTSEIQGTDELIDEVNW